MPQAIRAFLVFFLLAPATFGAERATEYIDGNRIEAYDLIKEIIEDDFKSVDYGKWISDNIEILPCDFNSLIIVHGEVRSGMTELAVHSIATKGIMIANDIPREVWAEHLRDYELSSVQRFGDESVETTDHEGLAEQINEELRERGIEKSVYSEDCGGDHQTYIASVRPRSAEARAIPKVFYKFCKKKDIDPLDEMACDNWLPAIRDNEEIVLGGLYYYVIINNGQTSKLKSVNADLYEDGERVPFK